VTAATDNGQVVYLVDGVEYLSCEEALDHLTDEAARQELEDADELAMERQLEWLDGGAR
jgi:hypothetical protein